MPEPTYLDRTKPDRDRVMEKVRPKLTKEDIKELLRRGGNILSGFAVANGIRSLIAETSGNVLPALTDSATPMASLPVALPEPRWRPGRDRPGGGPGGPPEGSNNIEDIIWLDIPWSELVEIIGLLFDLPFLMSKDKDKLTSYTLKVRGIKKSGPESRIDNEATFVARLERWRATYNARPEDYPDLTADDIPTVEQFPYDLTDNRYKRIEEKWEPDSKAVVFLLLDTSGSMYGETIAIARFYFLLNLIWLRSRYEEVDIVYIPHGGWAMEVETEEEFFGIDANGGTDFVPAYELSMDIANRRYPLSSYNRYLFHATDGVEDFPPRIAAALERLVDPGDADFNYVGLCIVDTWFGGSWKSQLEQAYDLLSDRALRRIGIGKVRSQDEVPEVMKLILTKDPVEAEA
jgi:uncharacterized sporulation protein YeaH/YhbH (DUF444 family)